MRRYAGPPRVLRIVERRGPIRTLIIDDTSMPKKSKHRLTWHGNTAVNSAKQDNCQVPVSRSAANDMPPCHLLIACRMDLNSAVG
ncbi:MAG: hypothetical protein QOF70_2351 [Acetobacteraceae bacterium]|jgi:SRSO17 transposase|nr:hypothetical protein [Acetobacteraceae bacterium]